MGIITKSLITAFSAVASAYHSLFQVIFYPEKGVRIEPLEKVQVMAPLDGINAVYAQVMHQTQKAKKQLDV